MSNFFSPLFLHTSLIFFNQHKSRCLKCALFALSLSCFLEKNICPSSHLRGSILKRTSGFAMQTFQHILRRPKSAPNMTRYSTVGKNDHCVKNEIDTEIKSIRHFGRILAFKAQTPTYIRSDKSQRELNRGGKNPLPISRSVSVKIFPW